ncbi:glucose 1-dehydrogenase [Jiangella muralis]|uniref:glucose 1-dehydrogenase n=1 Tax=Jiangella muralis TaxID=702383 RepID=UPI0009F85DEB|nr:glucose 1-dehydrogenase [Jiangella muralis]
MRFLDRIAIVTGGASGIGAAIARRMAGEGAVVVIADLDEERTTALASSLPRAVPAVLDVTDRSAVEATVARLDDAVGPVEILVNNAGAATDGTFDELSSESWDRDVAVNLTAPAVLTRTVLPRMVAAGRGAIVNVSSVNALAALGNDAYSAAKAGMLSLTRSIAVQYGQHGIRCNAVVPGTVQTPIWQSRLERDPQVFERAAPWYPLGRVGTPDDIAAAVLFLASDDAGWITGTSLLVDGGLMAGNARMMREITAESHHAPSGASR